MPKFKIFLRFLQWILYVALNFVFEVLAILFFNWWVPFFAVKIKPDNFLYNESNPEFRGLEETLPRWLKWFDTFDASIDAGWAGYYYTEPGEYTRDKLPSYWKRKWYQIRWLYRNAGYGFAYYPLGISIKLEDWTIYKYDYTAFKRFFFFAYDTRGYFQLQLRLPRGNFNIGWKIVNYYSLNRREWYSIQTGRPWGPEWRTMHVVSINPFKKNALPERD